MFTRILSSAVAGIAVTTGLLFLMQYLIASGEEIGIDERQHSELIWILLETDERLIVDPETAMALRFFLSPEPSQFPDHSRFAWPRVRDLHDGRIILK